MLNKFKVWNRWCWQLEHTNCKNYWELVTANFKLKFLMSFLDIWKKIKQKEPSDLDKRKKIRKIIQVSRKISVQEKKSYKFPEREVWLLFWLKLCSIISDYFRPILVLKFQLKSSVKTSAKTRGFLSLFIFLFFYSTLEPFWFLFEF